MNQLVPLITLPKRADTAGYLNVRELLRRKVCTQKTIIPELDWPYRFSLLLCGQADAITRVDSDAV
jgi:hypothetical protein